MWRFDLAAITADVRPAQVIRHHKNDVRTPSDIVLSPRRRQHTSDDRLSTRDYGKGEHGNQK